MLRDPGLWNITSIHQVPNLFVSNPFSLFKVTSSNSKQKSFTSLHVSLKLIAPSNRCEIHLRKTVFLT